MKHSFIELYEVPCHKDYLTEGYKKMEKFLSCILIGTFDSSEESHISSLLNFIENCKASDFFCDM